MLVVMSKITDIRFKKKIHVEIKCLDYKNTRDQLLLSKSQQLI